MTPLTKQEIEEIKRLETGATPGPWASHRHEPSMSGEYEILAVDGSDERSVLEYQANAEFITSFRNLAPRLIAYIEQLRDERGLTISDCIFSEENLRLQLRAIVPDDVRWAMGKHSHPERIITSHEALRAEVLKLRAENAELKENLEQAHQSMDSIG